MQCAHFDAGRCRSCTLIPIGHDRQLADARALLDDLLAPHLAAPAEEVWLPPIRSAESGFRIRAKMVVSGSANDPALGLLPHPESPAGTPGVDLADCPLYPSVVHELLEQVRTVIRRAQIPPYDVARRRGELKYVLVTASPDDEVMLRFVLRTTGPVPRLREHLAPLLATEPRLRVVTANIHPEHKATLEGPEEIHLAGADSLPMRTGDVTLQLRPQSFVQTNAAVASQLYRQVAVWIDELDDARARTARTAPLRIWDLYCGIGGFALHAARPGSGREVTGVELSEQAVRSARDAAAEAGRTASFHAADATTWAIQRSATTSSAPDVLIVNPPRRGIGERLSAWISASGVPDVLYSSCNPRSLARDLESLRHYEIIAGRYVDMFPHTEHHEVLVRLRRRTA